MLLRPLFLKRSCSPRPIFITHYIHHPLSHTSHTLSHTSHTLTHTSHTTPTLHNPLHPSPPQSYPTHPHSHLTHTHTLHNPLHPSPPQSYPTHPHSHLTHTHPTTASHVFSRLSNSARRSMRNSISDVRMTSCLGGTLTSRTMTDAGLGCQGCGREGEEV